MVPLNVNEVISIEAFLNVNEVIFMKDEHKFPPKILLYKITYFFIGALSPKSWRCVCHGVENPKKPLGFVQRRFLNGDLGFNEL